MLKIVFCLTGALVISIICEWLSQAKKLKPENRRKLTHISVGVFVAFWPWVISWQAIQLIGLAMLAVVVINHSHSFFKFSQHVARRTYGEYLFPASVSLCAILTHNKLFFALAILHLALADGLAAVVGKNFGSKSKYKIFGQTKTMLGTMTFWLTSLVILGIGLLLAHNNIGYNQYLLLILLLPPLLAMLENLALLGFDNLVVPVAVVLVLLQVQS